MRARPHPVVTAAAAMVAALIAVALGSLWAHAAAAQEVDIVNQSAAQCTTSVQPGYCFVPDPADVASGTTVTWKNQSSSATSPQPAHKITRCSSDVCQGVDGGSGRDNWSGDTGQIAPGETYSATFTAPGTYHYYCSIHGYGAAHGTVTVAALATLPPSATPQSTPTPTATPTPSATPSTSPSASSSPVALTTPASPSSPSAAAGIGAVGTSSGGSFPTLAVIALVVIVLLMAAGGTFAYRLYRSSR